MAFNPNSGWICVRYPKVIRDTIEREPVEMDGRMVPVDLDEDAAA